MQTETSNIAYLEGPARLTDMVRRFLLGDWTCRSDVFFAFGVSLIWLVFYNQRFWTDTLHAMWHGTFTSAAFIVSLFALVWMLQAMLLLLLPSRRLMVGAASLCFFIAAGSSFFAMKYGVVMNKDMLRNVFETDTAESRALLSADLIATVVMFGLLPAILVWKIRLPSMPALKRLRQHGIAIVGSLVIAGIALVSCSASYAVFFREHKPIRYSLMPVAPVTSALGVVFAKSTGGRGPLINASGVAHRTTQPRAKPLVIVLVVGETARAANFQLGGYARDTNPELSAMDGVVYFSQASSCGTSTAVSVPCMFSHLPRTKFEVDEAPRYANLLDALHDAGLSVEWRDNNAGCKGVCERVTTIQYAAGTDATLCPESYCYDEIMLQDLAGRLNDVHTDTVIVMHQIGSHGPAYSERYPPEFEKFKPACRSNQLQRCTAEEVTNAYDNTIAYTDHVLARAIGLLREASNDVDTMLLYVSDHGESLGEQGLYLHGLPYAFAPEMQKRVPMLIWMSPAYAAREGIAVDCLAGQRSGAVSHDNLYHTMLGAAEVRNDSYEANLDLLSNCRRGHWSADHE
jgi:lipid A ethanolaminephosphotransferase